MIFLLHKIIDNKLNCKDHLFSKYIIYSKMFAISLKIIFSPIGSVKGHILYGDLL